MAWTLELRSTGYGPKLVCVFKAARRIDVHQDEPLLGRLVFTVSPVSSGCDQEVFGHVHEGEAHVLGEDCVILSYQNPRRALGRYYQSDPCETANQVRARGVCVGNKFGFQLPRWVADQSSLALCKTG